MTDQVCGLIGEREDLLKRMGDLEAVIDETQLPVREQVLMHSQLNAMRHYLAAINARMPQWMGMGQLGEDMGREIAYQWKKRAPEFYGKGIHELIGSKAEHPSAGE